MTFKDEYRRAMDGIVPPDDFSEKLKTRLSDFGGGADKSVIPFKTKPPVRRIVTAVLSAACVVLLAGIGVHLLQSSGDDTMDLLVGSGSEMYTAAFPSSGNEEDLEDAEENEYFKLETNETESMYGDAAEGPVSLQSEANPETGGEGSLDGMPADVTSGAALNTIVTQNSVESISVETETKSDVSGGSWILLRVSSEDTEAFAEMLYESEAYAMVEEIESSLADSASGIQLRLTLSDGSVMYLTAYESGLVILEDLELAVYMECGSEAFANVWNACANAG